MTNSENDFDWVAFLQKENRKAELREIGKKGGRPSEERTEKFYIRLSKHEKKLLQDFSKNVKMSASKFAREKIFNHAIKELTAEEKEEIKLLSQFKINFARIGNMYRNKDDFREINKQVVEIAKLIENYIKSKL